MKVVLVSLVLLLASIATNCRALEDTEERDDTEEIGDEIYRTYLNRKADKPQDSDTSFQRDLESTKTKIEQRDLSDYGTCDLRGPVPQDCSDVDKTRRRTSGVYQVYIPNNSVGSRLVYCNLSIPKVDYLVFQRRKDGSENFERTWKDYANGFGNLHGEFWLGNEALYVLTNSFKYKLRIDLEDFDGQKRYAEYSSFTIASAAYNYRISVSGYSGDAGDSLLHHRGSQFSTIDADHDANPSSCAQQYHGAWWYNDCHHSNLNGRYLHGVHSSFADGIEWYLFRGHHYSLKSTEMKIARV